MPDLPDDRGLYATIFSKINGQWDSYQTISFSITPHVAKFTHPTDGSNAFDAFPMFTWFNNVQAGGYYLVVGTHPGGTDLINSGVLPATRFWYSPPELPTDTVLYATIFTNWAGQWNNCQSISFTLKAGAMFISPSNGQQNFAMTADYSWLPFRQAESYYLVVGTAPGAANLVNSGVLPPGQSNFHGVAMPKGVTLYGTIFTEIAGSWYHYQTITFASG